MVSGDEALHERLRRGLDGHPVFMAATDDEALRTLRTTAVDLVLKDGAPRLQDAPGFIRRVRQLRPSSVVVCVLPAENPSPDEAAVTDAADFVLRQPFGARHLQGVLRQAVEKLDLRQEVAALRASRGLAGPAGPPVDLAPAPEASSHTLAQVVREIARMLGAGFDVPRVLDLFLDAVSELLRPSRSAILLADPRARQYRVRAWRGLAPHLAESAVLRADEGLPLWLATEGRTIALEEAEARAAEPAPREIARELALLQAVLAVPLLAHGELVAVLVLGQRITGGAYHRHEAELLFTLATHLAAAIRDIRLHHGLQHQQECSERILAHMSSGVVTIDAEERIALVNRRAEEILGLAAPGVVGRDLRMLPSPLGDMLFESLRCGRAVTRAEVLVVQGRLTLEVSTYPITGEAPSARGAVLVFEDLTVHRQRAAEQRAAEQLQLLTRVIARIAEEIRNPLASIRIFTERLEEQSDDPALRTQVGETVGRDVRRLVEIFEKLAALVDEGTDTLAVVDARLVTEECLAELGAGREAGEPGEGPRLLAFTDEPTQKQVSGTYSHEGAAFGVQANRGRLKKALAYLVRYLLGKSPGQEARLAVSVSRPDGSDRVRLTVTSRTAQVAAWELDRLFDRIRVVQENLIDVGPCASQRIIEAHGGRLEARRGAREVSFAIDLPAVAP